MREFLLVVPDLPSPGAASGGEFATGASVRLRFDAARPLRAGWRAAVAAWLGRADLAAAPVAAVVAAAMGSRATPGAAVAVDGAWLATPLHLVAGLDTVHLPRDGVVGLAVEEREALSADFGRALGDGRMALQPAGPEAFVLTGLDLGAVQAVDPLECLGRDLGQLQPSGPGAVPLRRLMSEIEMWLHDHPVNRGRAARGARPVRALWLWGGATPPRPAHASAAVAGSSVPAGPGTASGPGAREPAVARGAGLRRRVFAADAWVRAATRLAGADLAPEGAMPDAATWHADGEVLVVARLHGEDASDAATFEARLLEPALVALRDGSLERLTVLTAERATAVEAADRYRLWRPRRDWLTALGA